MPLPLPRVLSVADGLSVGIAALRADAVVLGVGAAWLWALHPARGLTLMAVPEGQSRLAALVDWYAAPASLPSVLLFALIQLAAFMLRTWIEPGYLRAQRDVIMSGRGRTVVLLGGIDVFVPMLTVRAVNAAALAAGPVVGLLLHASGLPVALTVLGLALAGIAGAWVILGLQFATRLVALSRHDAVSALRASWDLTRGHRARLLVYDAAILGFLLTVAYLPGAIAAATLGAPVGFLVSLLTYVGGRAIVSVALTSAFVLATRETALVYRLMEPIAARLQRVKPGARIPAPDEPTDDGSYLRL